MKGKYIVDEQGNATQTPFTLFTRWADDISSCLITLDAICELYNKWLSENGYEKEAQRDIRLYLEYAGYKPVKAYDLSVKELAESN